MNNDKNKDPMTLLTKWDIELIDLERTLHETIEKSRKRIFNLKLELAKIEVAKPIQVDFGKGNRTGKPDRD